MKMLKHLPLVLSVSLATFMMTACQTVSRDTISTESYGATAANRNPTEVAKIRTTLAGQYLKAYQLDAAMRQLKLALIADNQYAQAYDMMGVLLQEEGSAANLQKAEGCFKKAIRLADLAQTHNNYGVYLFQVERYNEALKEFQIAGSRLGYRGRVDALENLGRTYVKLDKQTEAIQTFYKVLDNNPDSLVAHIELVDLFIIQQRYEQAKYFLQKTLTLLDNQNLPPRVIMQQKKL